VEKVTSDAVKTAASRMKSRKSNVSGSFTSDCLRNGPDILFEMLASVFRGWLVHGSVTTSVLAYTFLPLLKSSNPSTETSSYRAIAGSSLILKLFEKTVLELWGDMLHSDGL
jgi:hypothetical protein